MESRVYLDWNATAPLRDEAREVIGRALTIVGNPSSIHAEGRQARRVVEEAREKVAALVGTHAENVIFTSSGTEANVLALTPSLQVDGDRSPRGRLLISAVEHASVRAGGRFPPERIDEIPVTSLGVVDLGVLAERIGRLADQGIARPLVSIMLANNETGILQPVGEAAEIVHAAGGLLHVDAVQAAGKVGCDIQSLGADLLTLSAHKLGGPKGVGALVKGNPALHLSDPLIKGGGQERGARAGTENVAGIAGFGAAAEAAAAGLAHAGTVMALLRGRLENGLRAISPDILIFGEGAERLPNTTLFAVPGVKAETALIALDLDGMAVSSGSACSSGKIAASHVLQAMGVASELARGAIRVSSGFSSAESDIDRFLNAWSKVLGTLSRGRVAGAYENAA